MSSVFRPHLHVVIYSPFPRYSGGRENWLYNVLRQLDRLGYGVTVYALKSDRPLFYDLGSLSSVRLVSIPNLRQRSRLFQLANALTLRALWLVDSMYWFPRATSHWLMHNVQDGDVILAMNPIIDIAPALHLRLVGRRFRLVCSVRGLCAMELSRAIPYLGKTFYRLEKQTLAKADRILANGYDTQAYLQTAGFDSWVIFNGVDVARFSNPNLDDPALAQVKDWHDQGIKIVATVATLGRIKGILSLLRAAWVLKTVYSKPFRGVFIGKGNPKPYQRYARELGLTSEVYFAGEQANISGFLYYADVLACLSGGAGMAMACIEGMAASRTIIAWDTPVYRQLIEHGKSGWLVPHGDDQSLGEAIGMLLESPGLASRLGHRAQADAMRYDWTGVVQQLVPALYEWDEVR